MFCTECGKRLDDDAKFCSGCGKPQKPASGANAEQENRQTGESKPGEKQQGFFSKLGLGKKDEDEKTEKPHKQESFTLPDTIDDSIETQHAAISSNGKYLAVSIYNEGYNKPQIMDTKSKEVVHNIKIKVNSGVSVSPSGNLIMVDGYDEHYLWDFQKNIKIYRQFGPSRYISVFSPDSKMFVCRLNYDANDLEVIKTEDGKKLFTIQGSFLISNLAYSPDGRYLAASIGIIWDARNGSIICKLKIPPSKMLKVLTYDQEPSIVFSHNGKHVITFKNSVITIWDTQMGSILLQFGEERITSNDEDCAICLSPDDRTLAAGYGDGIIQFFNVETGELLKQLQGDKKSIEWLSFTPNGEKLISYAGNTVKFWVADN